jgi:hypothetical protein
MPELDALPSFGQICHRCEQWTSTRIAKEDKDYGIGATQAYFGDYGTHANTHSDAQKHG